MQKINRKKVILVILDGFGYGHDDKTNAIYLAQPKTFYSLINNFPNIKIEASEEAVALPAGQPGNSEVGHLTIGAGRIFHTGIGIINHAIKTKEFFNNEEILKAINNAKEKQSNVHILGLASDGDVHASLNHILATIDLCNEHKVIPVLDLFSDGRDTQEKDFINSIKIIKEKYLDTNKAKLGTISGRYYAMDRNGSWDRTELTFDALTSVGENTKDPVEFIEECYAKDLTDEFIKPMSFNNAETILRENDSMIFANFRSDRIRQLIHLFTKNPEDYAYMSERTFPVYIVGFMDYKMKGMQNIAFIQIPNTEYIGKIAADNKLKQLRIAETEKYAHVTYFLDSMNKDKDENCDCILIPSPSVATYDLQPEMSAKFITDYIVDNFSKYDLIVANYANSDMVGHTGNMAAAEKAVKCIDEQLKRLTDAILKDDEYVMIITADHGNADEMLDNNGIIVTKHTTNLVPFVVLDKSVDLQPAGSLVNIAPTILDYLQIDKPDCMEESLIIRKGNN
ncbi:MAG: 2,3-bisphosphoglycerate-independent phosphoglycerate mutase [Mycoplasma sp.]